MIVSVRDLRPAPLNPNEMTAEMYQKALASIRAFNFVDPITARETDEGFEIVDGEHRWRAAVELGMSTVPIWNLGRIPDEVAQQLTIILNETRGQPNENRLATLVRSLSESFEARKLVEVLPFSAERFAELSGRRDGIDFAALESKRRAIRSQTSAGLVERVYRLPRATADRLDEAIEQAKRDEGVDLDWKALDLIVGSYLTDSD